MDTLAETAGLCTLCHGTNVDAMDFYAGSKLWLPGMANGHSNSCLGGTGANEKDLFTGNPLRLRDGPAVVRAAASAAATGTTRNFPECAPSKLCPSRAAAAGSSPTAGGTGADYANWYGTGTIGGADGAGIEGPRVHLLQVPQPARHRAAGAAASRTASTRAWAPPIGGRAAPTSWPTTATARPRRPTAGTSWPPRSERSVGHVEEMVCPSGFSASCCSRVRARLMPVRSRDGPSGGRAGTSRRSRTPSRCPFPLRE